MPAGQHRRSIIEQDREFSRSTLWDWQRQYYDSAGVETWRDGRTPHYITSNPRIARHYVEIVLAFVRDLRRNGTLHDGEPVHVLEIGAGSGRFSYHFLHWLRLLSDVEGLDWRMFRYVISDAAAGNVEFCRAHPRLQDALDAGVLDTSHVDVANPGPIFLDRQASELLPGALRNPLVLVANYVFDSLPSHLFHLDGRTAHLGYTTLREERPADAPADRDLRSIEKSLVYRRVPEGLFAQPLHRRLMDHYAASMSSTHLLFPIAALTALEFYRGLSASGMMVLTADKGTHVLSDLDGCPPPDLVQHGGGFSVPVNYHALAAHCSASGGVAFFPEEPHEYLDVGCLLYVADAVSCTDTRRAFRQQIAEFGPDAFEAVVDELHSTATSSSFRGIMAHLRLSFYDSVVLDIFFARLLELVPDIGDAERHELARYLDRVWDAHYPIGESLSTASQIGCLLYEMDDYEGALAYFERSVEIFGPNTGVLHNMALCCLGMNRDDTAAQLLRLVVRHEPDNAEAQALLRSCERSPSVST